jgi:hypothetical protein
MQNIQANPSIRRTKFSPRLGSHMNSSRITPPWAICGYKQRNLDSADQSDQTRQQGFGITRVVWQHGCQTAADKRQKQ